MAQTIKRSMVQTLAVATTLALLTVGAIAPHATSVPLSNGAKIDGYIRSSSPGYRYRSNTGTRGMSLTARGEDHTFSARQGETIEITVQAEDGSTLQPILVLFDPTGRQVAMSNNPGVFRYQTTQAGTYRLLVLGQNNSLGRYTLAFNGMATPGSTGASTTVPSQPVGQADQVMNDILRLRVIGCGVPRVAKIQIGTEERCTRDIEPGVYSYNANTKSIQLVDSRRDLLASKLQLTLLENCPSPATSVVQIVMTDAQDNRDYTYCAQPTRYLKAGAYRYNPATDSIAAIETSTPVNPTIPVDPKAATRKQILLQEYGLNVLDNCPATRSRFVVVNFPEGGQLYQYCANPNRLIAAGEYTYDENTGGLNKAGTTNTASDCAVSVGGICLLKK